MNKTCIYYCEGEDDQKLVDALKRSPSKILPGKSKKLISNFKADFRKMKDEQRRNTLERHKIDVTQLWITKAPREFDFIERNSDLIKNENAK